VFAETVAGDIRFALAILAGVFVLLCLIAVLSRANGE
jgi:hypothetical protein